MQFENFIELVLTDLFNLERYRPFWMVPPYYNNYPDLRFYYLDILNLLFLMYLISRSLGKHSNISTNDNLNGTQKLNMLIHFAINFFMTRQRQDLERYTSYSTYLKFYDGIYINRSIANINYLSEIKTYLTKPDQTT